MFNTSHTPRRKTALVTGASSGIGREFARILAAEGHDLVIVARRPERLEQLASDLTSRNNVSIRCYAKDLSVPGASNELWEELINSDIPVDVLINNAGIGAHGVFEMSEPDVLVRMMELNVVALTNLTRLAVPTMLQRQWGRILNVASVAGFQPGGPRMAVYYATKSYVLSFSKGLARELKGTGVSVTALCPGPTETSFEETSHAQDTWLYKHFPQMSATDVARSGLQGMQRRRAVVIPGLLSKALAIGGELPPRRFALEVNRLLLRGAASVDVALSDQ